MKIVNLIIALLIFFGFTATSAHATTFSDDFNDGNTEGWISSGADYHNDLGNWQVINGVLSEDGRDHSKLLVDGLTLSNQSVETKILFHDGGYAGITVWRYDLNNWVDVYIYPGVFLSTIEHFDGVENRYFYPNTNGDRCLTCWEKNTWYTMRVDANSLTGEIAIYVDGEYITTHTVATPHRTGLTGLNGGNAGGSFDNFTITPANGAPIASAGADQTLVLGEQVTLDGSGSTDPDGMGDIVSYSWNLGDGESSSGAIVNHTYLNSGVYTATLTVTDTKGAVNSDTVAVTVLTPTQAIQNIIQLVQTYNLQQGIANNLDAKLDTAFGALGDLNENNNQAAINSLQSFINAVNAQRGVKITDQQADNLIQEAQTIINSLSN
jgi:hypothetical protein